MGAASKEPGRFQLTGVHFVSNGSLEAVATDGKQLTRLRWNEPAEGDEKVTIDTDSLKTVKKTLGKTDTHFSLEPGDDPYKRNVELREATVIVPVLNGVYPDYDSVLDPAGLDRTYLVDPFILRDQITVMIGVLGLNRKDGTDNRLTMRCGTKKGTPIVFEGRDKSHYLSATGLVMPIVQNKGK